MNCRKLLYENIKGKVYCGDYMLGGIMQCLECQKMINKKNEICECGHDFSWHIFVKPLSCDYDDCKCKKFKPILDWILKDQVNKIIKNKSGFEE